MYDFDKRIRKIIKPKQFGGKNDRDCDGVPNRKDCQPNNTMRQDKVNLRKDKINPSKDYIDYDHHYLQFPDNPKYDDLYFYAQQQGFNHQESTDWANKMEQLIKKNKLYVYKGE